VLGSFWQSSFGLLSSLRGRPHLQQATYSTSGTMDGNRLTGTRSRDPPLSLVMTVEFWLASQLGNAKGL
jgi:hypothetical protein